MSAQEPKIQEVTEETTTQQGIPEGAEVSVQSRGEKKARQLIAKLNLKKVDGVSRVVFRRSGGAVFAISNPVVYKNPATGSYVVFGEAQVDTQTQNLVQQLAALSAGDNGAAAAGASAPKDPVTADLEEAVKQASIKDNKPEEEDIADEDVDTTGLKDFDIETVQTQANISKAKAVAALRRNNGDIVNTIMELTT